MPETLSLINQLQQKYFATEGRKYLDQLHDAVEVIAYIEELFQDDYTENAY